MASPGDDWGVFTDFAVGPHQVCFGPVEGYVTPACHTVNLLAGTTGTAAGSPPRRVSVSGTGRSSAIPQGRLASPYSGHAAADDGATGVPGRGSPNGRCSRTATPPPPRQTSQYGRQDALDLAAFSQTSAVGPDFIRPKWQYRRWSEFGSTTSDVARCCIYRSAHCSDGCIALASSATYMWSPMGSNGDCNRGATWGEHMRRFAAKPPPGGPGEDD